MCNKRGFTLIELVTSIVVLSVTMSGLVIVWQIMQKRYVHEARSAGIFLAQRELDRVIQKRFADIADENGGSRGQKITLASPFAAYSYEVIVDPVNASNLNTVVAGPTDFHKVRVIVNNALTGSLELVTLVTQTG